MPSIHGILETALYVRDLQQAANFYRRLFNFPTLLESDRLIALDVAGRNVLLLFQQGVPVEALETPGGTIPAHDGSGRNHLAFSIVKADLDDWRERLAGYQIAMESEVVWPAGAHSLYFRDPDEHLVELVTPGLWRT